MLFSTVGFPDNSRRFDDEPPRRHTTVGSVGGTRKVHDEFAVGYSAHPGGRNMAGRNFWPNGGFAGLTCVVYNVSKSAIWLC